MCHGKRKRNERNEALWHRDMISSGAEKRPPLIPRSSQGSDCCDESFGRSCWEVDLPRTWIARQRTLYTATDLSFFFSDGSTCLVDALCVCVFSFPLGRLDQETPCFKLVELVLLWWDAVCFSLCSEVTVLSFRLPALLAYVALRLFRFGYGEHLRKPVSISPRWAHRQLLPKPQ